MSTPRNLRFRGDPSVEKGLNWSMGPFRLGAERYRPSPQLEAKVKAGKLARKTGEGWYKY